jgi:tRNA A37 methylthiotransferase MiaB
MKLGLVSLGCDKNTVDSERILAMPVEPRRREISTKPMSC